jgi:putative hydrolase of the HAD superfamily
MKKYNHLIFDLDHTLWDFERNSSKALEEIYLEMDLASKGVVDFLLFYHKYKEINEQCWADYRHGKLEKAALRTIRFKRTLNHFNIDDDTLTEEICDSYLYKSPRKPHLIEGSNELLTYLKTKYQLHILTNGFAEIQSLKMQHSGLDKYFTHVIASEKAGEKKPHPQAFRYALDQIGARAEECIMIGDNPETDIDGARKIGMDTIYFNRDGAFSKDIRSTHQVYKLSEIQPIL